MADNDKTATPAADTGSGDDNLAQLRKNAAEAATLREENLSLRKTAAFREAGIAVGDGKPGNLLYATMQPGEDGQFSAEAVLAYAQANGINPTPATETEEAEPAPSPTGVATSGEAEFFERSRNQTTGAETAPSGTGNPYEDGYQRFDDEMKNGVQREKASGAAIGAIFQGAAKGDTRVLYDQAEWRQRHGG